MAKSKRKTLGKMSNIRLSWKINPTTRVVKDKTKYTRKIKHKKSVDTNY